MGCTFHLGAVALEVLGDAVLYRFVCDKLIAADDSSAEYLNLRIYLMAGFLSQFHESLICLERKGYPSEESVPADSRNSRRPYHDEPDQ